jgi:hypothetical protein
MTDLHFLPNLAQKHMIPFQKREKKPKLFDGDVIFCSKEHLTLRVSGTQNTKSRDIHHI